MIKSLKVKSAGVKVADFVNVDTNLYKANIKVEFETANLVRPIRPISIKTLVSIDAVGAITSCRGEGGKAFGGVYDDCTCKGWG